jgi:hypothetical protein
LYVSDDRELCTGRMSGMLSSARGLRHAKLGRAQKLIDLRHTLWMVERASLDDAIVDEQAIVLPETLVDKERFPRAHGWLAALPLVAVSGLKWSRLVEQDRVRLYRVAVDEKKGDVAIEVEAAGGGREPWRIRVGHGELLAAVRAAAGERLAIEAPASPVDRLLRQLSAGAVSDDAVIAAWQASQLIEPGYGYRGATDGSPASIEEIEREVAPLDAVCAQIEERAQRYREKASAIVEALRAARDSDAEEVPVPVYRQARRLVEKEVRVELRDYEVAGEPQPQLVLPSYPRWFVAEVEEWEPTAPPGLVREREEPGESKPPSQWLVLAMMLLLCGIAIISFVLRGR